MPESVPSKSAAHQDLIPEGFLRLDGAHRDLVEQLNIADERDRTSGLPRNWKGIAEPSDAKLAEWSGRVALHARAEHMLIAAITVGQPKRLTVWTRPAASSNLSKVDPALFGRPGVRLNHSIATGRYLTFEHRGGALLPEYEFPLFIREVDWALQKEIWSREGIGLRRHSSKAESECVDWLAAQFADVSTAELRKPHIWQAAQSHFGSRLSERAFDRAWGKVAPQFDRNKRGAPKKTPR